MTRRKPKRRQICATQRTINQSPHMPTYIVEQILQVQERLEHALPWEREALEIEVARLRKLAEEGHRR